MYAYIGVVLGVKYGIHGVSLANIFSVISMWFCFCNVDCTNMDYKRSGGARTCQLDRVTHKIP